MKSLVRSPTQTPADHVLAECEGHRWATRQSAPAPVHQVEPGDAGGLDDHSNLTGSRLRRLLGDRYENLGSTVSRYDDAARHVSGHSDPHLGESNGPAMRGVWESTARRSRS